MTYYGGICSSTFSVELSNDGERWTEPVWAEFHTSSTSGLMFRWLWFVPHDNDGISQNALYQDTVPADDGSAYIVYPSSGDSDPMQTSRYVRVTADTVDHMLRSGRSNEEILNYLQEGTEILPNTGTSDGEHPHLFADLLPDRAVLLLRQPE